MEIPNESNTHGVKPEPTNGSGSINPVIHSPPMASGPSNNVGSMPMGPVRRRSAALDVAIEHEKRMGTVDPNMDEKSMRKIVSNRYAAKKSHIRKVNYMTELEKHQKDLEGAIVALHPRIEQEKQRISRLRLENEMLTRQLQIRTNLDNVKQAEIAEKTMERQYLEECLTMHAHQFGN